MNLQYERLKWISTAKMGEALPQHLFFEPVWGPAFNEAAQWALDEIAFLEKRLKEHGIPPAHRHDHGAESGRATHSHPHDHG